jgi:ATP-dependent Zn protease
MRKSNLNFVALFAIVATLFLGSCGTTKYQDMGFGGRDFKSFKSSSNFELKKNQESLSATTAIELQNAKSDLQEPIEINKIQINKSVNPKIVSTILSKAQTYLTKPTGNFITDKINNVKAKVLQKVTKKISDSKWPNSDSSFWKWLLTIISVLIFLLGLSVLIASIDFLLKYNLIEFGLLGIIIAIGIILIGYLFLLWARNVQ